MNKYLLIVSLISFNLFASESGSNQFGRIVELKGSGFISYKGKTRELVKGDTLEAGAEIFIEHIGQVTFTDNADHRFHLGNSSSASVAANSIELRSGDLWFQSLNKNDEYKVTTANAMISYQGGEAILSYDVNKGKTQLMVINGMMKLSNIRATELNLSVSEGHFSFIDNAYEEGAPRDPTPVGEKTYAQLVGLFNGISPMDKKSVAIFNDQHKAEHHSTESEKPHASREIASVAAEEVHKKVKLDDQLLEEYKNTLLNKTSKKTENKKFTHKVSLSKNQKTSHTNEKMAVHIYGQSLNKVAAETSIEASKSRAPASVLDENIPKEAAGTLGSSTQSNPYTKEFKDSYKESDKLIEDLKKL